MGIQSQLSVEVKATWQDPTVNKWQNAGKTDARVEVKATSEPLSSCSRTISKQYMCYKLTRPALTRQAKLPLVRETLAFKILKNWP